MEYFRLIGIKPVREIYRGVFDEGILKEIASTMDTAKQEGYVIRLADAFRFEDFSKSIAKYVRKNHVQTDKHWKFQKIVQNHLAGKE